MGRRPKVTRDEVLAAAREAFAERGFEATTLAAIAGRLAVSPAALLRHAPSKEALFSAAMGSGPRLRLPMEFLAGLDGTEDPREVLRGVGEVFVPFIEQRLDETVACWMRAKSLEEARLHLPFDPSQRPTPPERALGLIEEYFRRAVAAGRMRLADPRAAALTFLGALHSYVVLHRVVRIQDPPLPLERYLDALLEVWTHGAISAAAPARRRREAARTHPAGPRRRESGTEGRGR
jgi:AcrR family transcriptional regulator